MFKLWSSQCQDDGKLHDMSGHDMEELSIVCLTQKDIPYSGNSLVALHC